MNVDTEFFSKVANCYAYAVKCAEPVNAKTGLARPGLHKYSGDADREHQNFTAGVLADGGPKVNALGGRISVPAFVPANVPQPRADWYLIGLLVKANGFHFMRRQRKSAFGTPFWKWKQGNGGLVERNAYDPVAGDYVRITDALLGPLIQGTYRTEMPGYKDWVWLQFFEVQKSGFTVTASP